MKRHPLLLLSALAFAGLAGSAHAQAKGDLTPLGRSAASGAVCQAIRDYDDPAVQMPAARAWSIRCLGWDVSIGRLYLLPTSGAVADWRKGFADRATCTDVKKDTIAHFADVQRSICRNTEVKAPYAAYVGKRGRFTVVAEGYAQVADVLQTGMKVMSGVMKPPAAAESQSSKAVADIAADFGGEMSGLASAEKAVAANSSRLLARGYVQNSEWRFDAAESDFRSLVSSAQGPAALPSERAVAILNLALNISNNGRFAEADDLFTEADAAVEAAGDQALKAEALNYRALHLRNQRKFAAAATMAEKALAARQLARTSASFTSNKAVKKAVDAATIDENLSDALNTRAGQQALTGDGEFTAEMKLNIQDAETYELIGSSKSALGEMDAARTALEQASARLSLAEAKGAETVRLRSRVEADLGDVELVTGHAALASGHYREALKVIRTRHSGSPPEAAMLMDLGRAQIAEGQQEAALESYGAAFDVFKRSRGSLGASADAAEPYLDLLIDLIKKDPSKGVVYQERFFSATETVVSDATAATVARLAARVASGDDATSGLVRAVDDSRRDLAAAESRIAALQTKGAYVGDAKLAADAEVKALRSQLAAVNAALLTANPRYDQLVASTSSMADVQKVLHPDEVYLKTLLLGDRGYGLLITPTSAVPYAIPKSREAIVGAAMELRSVFETDETVKPYDMASAHELFEDLFGPAKVELLKAKHLIYEPDASLISVPAAIFVTDQASVDLVKGRPKPKKGATPDYRDVAWLGTKVDSSLVLSAPSFIQARAFQPSHARKLYLGFGNPTMARTEERAYASLIARAAAVTGPDAKRAMKICQASRQALLKMDALPDTEKEVRIVAGSLGAPPTDTLLGPGFDDGVVRSRKDLSDYKVLYFATHALLPMPDACLPEPALITSLGSGDSDGLLDAAEIVNLKLDAELVVLSACDTGGGGATDSATGLAGGGEALGGLTRAVIYAGARGMIVSHWSVDSEATEKLMTGLFRSGAGSVAAGLQKSQAAMQADPRLSHPYFWAPFTVVGDGARPIPSNEPSTLKAEAPPATAAGRKGS